MYDKFKDRKSLVRFQESIARGSTLDLISGKTSLGVQTKDIKIGLMSSTYILIKNNRDGKTCDYEIFHSFIIAQEPSTVIVFMEIVTLSIVYYTCCRKFNILVPMKNIIPYSVKPVTK